MRLLLLGGTGFLGPRLVDVCRDRGHHVTLFNRGRSQARLGKAFLEGLDILTGDRDTGDLASLEAAIAEGARWDAVIDTSGYVPSHVKKSATVLRNAAEHYLFVSTVSVYAPLTEPGLDESHPVLEVSDEEAAKVEKIGDVSRHGHLYGPLKARCEVAAEEAMPGRALSLRPGLIVGPGDPSDRYTYWPVRATMADRCGGRMLVPGTAERPHAVQYVDVRDLAELAVTCCERRETGAMNGVADPVLLTDVVSAARAHAGTDLTLAMAPMEFLKAQGVGFWAELPMVVPAEGAFAGFASVHNGRAKAVGMTQRPAADTATATLDWWRTLPPERQSQLRAGLSEDREQALLDALAEG